MCAFSLCYECNCGKKVVKLVKKNGVLPFFKFKQHFTPNDAVHMHDTQLYCRTKYCNCDNRHKQSEQVKKKNKNTLLHYGAFVNYDSFVLSLAARQLLLLLLLLLLLPSCRSITKNVVHDFIKV